MRGSYSLPMTLTLNLPDGPALRHVSEAEMRLVLACALHAQGRISKTAGAEMAGLDLFAFQQALGEREISTYTVDDLHDEVDALRSMFPAQTLPPSK
jgi:predicted HTH domain antitoxin